MGEEGLLGFVGRQGLAKGGGGNGVEQGDADLLGGGGEAVHAHLWKGERGSMIIVMSDVWGWS